LGRTQHTQEKPACRTHRQSLHEGLGTRAGDRAEVVHQIGLGHADTGVLDDEGLGLLVGDQADLKGLLGVELAGVRQRQVADLVDGIASVGDKLTKENFLFCVSVAHDRR